MYPNYLHNKGEDYTYYCSNINLIPFKSQDIEDPNVSTVLIECGFLINSGIDTSNCSEFSAFNNTYTFYYSFIYPYYNYINSSNYIENKTYITQMSSLINEGGRYKSTWMYFSLIELSFYKNNLNDKANIEYAVELADIGQQSNRLTDSNNFVSFYLGFYYISTKIKIKYIKFTEMLARVFGFISILNIVLYAINSIGYDYLYHYDFLYVFKNIKKLNRDKNIMKTNKDAQLYYLSYDDQ